VHHIAILKMLKIVLFQLFFFVAVISSNEDGTSERDNTAVSPSVIKSWPPASSSNPAVTDLHNEYNNIFRYGNRNAASHLWATFLLQRASQMTVSRLEFFFQGFCSVSGSPVRPSDYTRYRVTLPKVKTNSKITGFMYYCCWPCICDTQDFIRVDTLTITDKDGVATKQNFAVIGNPCDDPSKLHEPFVQPFYGMRSTTLAETAVEVRCGDGGVLEGATVSDNGYIIIGMFFNAIDLEDKAEDSDSTQISKTNTVKDATPGRLSKITVLGNTVNFHDEREWSESCLDRARDGYNSGMGEIFRKVCAISPIQSSLMHETGNIGSVVIG